MQLATVRQVFDSQFMDNTSGYVIRAWSRAIPAEGNTVGLATTLYNLSGSNFIMRLEGTYDGVLWKDMGIYTYFETFGFQQATVAASKFAFVRAMAACNGKGFFDATISFSQL